MKKFFVCAFAAAAMLSMTSCGGPASKAEGFAEDMLEAMQDGDFDKYCDVVKEQAEYEASLDKDDKKEYDDAAADWATDHAADLEKAARKWLDALQNASEKDKNAMKEAEKAARKLEKGQDVDEDED